MFTFTDREKIRTEILDRARNDRRISGGAITGSASVDNQDTWSDIDLAFGIQNSNDLPQTIADYTEQMYTVYKAIHHLDVFSGAWVYRVFFLSNTLQVDLAFAPEKEFGARASTFKLIFGKTGSISHDPSPTFESLVGWCWLNALHVRSSLKRNRLWQGEYFISAMRDYVISLCCRRYGLPEKQGRGVDQLPNDERMKFEPSLVSSMNLAELWRAFSCVVSICLEEIEIADSALRGRLEPTIKELSEG